MKRRFAIVCMAVWLTGTIWMAVVATQNLFTIDRLFDAAANSGLAAAAEKLGEPETRLLLIYLSSELNRLFFQIWGLLQIGIGILALWLVVAVPKSAKAKWMIVSMLGIALLFSALIMPHIVSLGRELDFIPRDPPPPGLRTYGLLYATYTVLDGIKFILGILATIILIRPSRDLEM